MKKNLIYLILTAVLLTGCGLTVAEPKEDTSGLAIVQSTAPETIPVPMTDSVPAVTLPDTKPALEGSSGETMIPLQEPQYVLHQSANAMIQADSYEYTQTSVSHFGENQISYVTEAVMFPLKGDGMITREESGFQSITYLKNHIMYREDTATGKWVYIPMAPPDVSPVEVHERVNDYMEVQRTEEGYLLSSNRPLTLLEFYSITGIEESEKETIQALEEQGVSLETMVQIRLDEEYRFMTVVYDQVTTSGGVTSGTLDEYEYRNYGSAPEVVVPPEILDEAVEYVSDPNASEEP